MAIGKAMVNLSFFPSPSNMIVYIENWEQLKNEWN